MKQASIKRSRPLRWWRDTPAACLAALIFIMGLGWVSSDFPPVNSDEAFLANHAFNLYRGATNRYSLYDDLFESSLPKYRDAQAGVLQIGYEAFIGPFVSGKERSLQKARRASLFAGFLCLVLLYVLGRQLAKGSGVGWAAMGVAAMCPMFWLSATLLRAEIVLLLAMVGIFVLAGALSDSTIWKYPLLGFVAGLCCSIHQNIAPLFTGIMAVLFFRKSLRGSRFQWIVFLLTFAVGIVTVFSWIDLPAFMLSQRSGIYELYKPPIFRWPWNPWEWFSTWMRLMLTGKPTWYLRGDTGVWWSGSLLFYWGATGGLVLGYGLGLRKIAPGAWKAALPWLAGFIVSLLAFCALVKKQEALYTGVWLAFWSPAIAILLAGLWQHARTSTTLRVGLALAMVISPAFYLRFQQDYRHQYIPHAQVIQTLRELVPAGSRVAGPAAVWLGWPEDEFRDISALVGSRWLTGGRRDVERWLSGWKPDVLIIEESWKRMLLGRGETQDLLEKALPCPVKAQGRVDTGSGSEGVYEVFTLQWS